ncbi:tripartite tricarboxylate transporter TctB family protein [Zobellella endophytica]|uniref:Tripartite tricarboxylate transporter TctB family protein n=1 Tax=Zobellella endophytica TaxID=2116700 RepID=A0A2P7R806_9GAMM|nr:tripartite tricarboxylate transporter TctB family protein [Zobellella endophytica]PSJ46358.1 tripartite tricarboxylate transporter TctB family protein [Zobellella endophytica]
MIKRDFRGVIGGLGLSLAGGFAAWYGNGNYQVGGIHDMGPGFLPVILGGVLALLGLLIAIPAWFRAGEAVGTEWASAFFVILSLLVFGGLLALAGLVVATVLAALVALIPDRKLGTGRKINTALGIAAITYAVFSLGLGMAVKTWPWG